MEQVRRRAGRFGLEIVSVNVWEHHNARHEARHFCDVHGLDHPVLLDRTGECARRLGVRGVPMNILVDQRGTVRAVGATTPNEVRAALTTLFTAP